MLNFYCLYNSGTNSLNLNERLASLRKSCNKLGLTFIEMDQAFTDFSDLPTLTGKDILYNCARGSFVLETSLLNRQVITVYRNYNFIFLRDDPNQLEIELAKRGVPVAKTIHLGTNNRKLLSKYVEYLGGLPLVIKIYGSTGGQGAIKIDSVVTLYSLTDYLVSNSILFQIKEFVPSKSCERVNVLHNRVHYTLSRPILNNDFRSTAFTDQVKLLKLSRELEQIAIQAAKAANLDYAGIDMIVDERNSEAKVLEINCPQNFYQAEVLTGLCISEELIKMLIEKTNT